MQKLFSFITLFSLLCLLIVSCTERENAPVEVEIPVEGESYAYISTHPEDPFLSDSVDLVVEATTGGNLFILSYTAHEKPDMGDDYLSFTAFGILMPGTKIIDETIDHGVAVYYNSDLDKNYISAANGGEGTIEVLLFEEPYEHVMGEFNFTLIDTLTGEMITVVDGFFDTDVDTLK